MKRRESKLPVPWKSKVPKHYKRKIILGELCCAKKIASHFPKEVKNIKEKFSKADFPVRFINSAVTQFSNKTYYNNETNRKDEIIIPPQLFVIPKKVLFLRVPFFEVNEERSKGLNQNINHTFTWSVICCEP